MLPYMLIVLILRERSEQKSAYIRSISIRRAGIFKRIEMSIGTFKAAMDVYIIIIITIQHD